MTKTRKRGGPAGKGEFCSAAAGNTCQLAVFPWLDDDTSCTKFNATSYCNAARNGQCVARTAQEGAPCTKDISAIRYDNPCADGLVCDVNDGKCISAGTFIQKNKGLLTHLHRCPDRKGAGMFGDTLSSFGIGGGGEGAASKTKTHPLTNETHPLTAPPSDSSAPVSSTCPPQTQVSASHPTQPQISASYPPQTEASASYPPPTSQPIASYPSSPPPAYPPVQSAPAYPTPAQNSYPPMAQATPAYLLPAQGNPTYSGPPTASASYPPTSTPVYPPQPGGMYPPPPPPPQQQSASAQQPPFK
ncbi:hypothetical protein H9P43_005522 [Blastocladiella emersonii ATCC 22665]|nr:hypothetical protein H9P43_005522 [Blastocladiella emersonii ATCC 22665]